jgi:hypothetical protein
MEDMNSWRPTSCFEADVIRRQGSGLSVASSLTDQDGEYGQPTIFTEWWWNDRIPVLRDYRYPGQHGAPDYRPCRHFIAQSLEAADREEDEP